MAPSFLKIAKIITVAMILTVSYVSIWRKEDASLSRKPIVIHSSSEHLEQVLSGYKEIIGSDYDGYRNHIYRVLTYSLHYLDADSAEVKKFIPVIESALVYHDIGLWTDRQLSYLEPSSFRAKERFGGEYSEEELTLLHNIIYWHHKVTPFEGDHADIVNAVRKADWVDATMGLVNHGMPPKHITAVTGAIAEAGFHNTLAAIGPRYYGFNVVRIVTELSSILKW